jgi:adenylylsulfate kinase
MEKQNFLVPHAGTVTRGDRSERLGHNACVLWFTGLSGAGKSTLSHAVERELFNRGCQTFVLDGDNFRHGVCRDLGFSERDRNENIRRAGEVAKLFLESGTIVLAAFISPLSAHRQFVRALMPDGDFIEIYCKASVEICEARDTKGFYKKARLGEIRAFTGIDSPYEVPDNPELTVETGQRTVEASVTQVIEHIEHRGILKR